MLVTGAEEGPLTTGSVEVVGDGVATEAVGGVGSRIPHTSKSAVNESEPSKELWTSASSTLKISVLIWSDYDKPNFTQANHAQFSKYTCTNTMILISMKIRKLIYSLIFDQVK